MSKFVGVKPSELSAVDFVKEDVVTYSTFVYPSILLSNFSYARGASSMPTSWLWSDRISLQWNGWHSQERRSPRRKTVSPCRLLWGLLNSGYKSTSLNLAQADVVGTIREQPHLDIALTCGKRETLLEQGSEGYHDIPLGTRLVGCSRIGWHTGE